MNSRAISFAAVFTAFFLLLIVRPGIAKAYNYTFSDNFDSLNTGNLTGQNGWTVGDPTDSNGAEGNWMIGAGGPSSGNMAYWNNDNPTTYDFFIQYMSNGSSTLTDQRVQADFAASFNDVSTSGQNYIGAGNEKFNYSPQFLLRRTASTGDAGEYGVLDNAGVWTIFSHTAGSAGAFTTLATANTPIPLNINTWYTGVAQVVNNASGNPVISFWVYPQGTTMPVTPTLTYTDTSNTFQSGYFGFGTAAYPIDYDNVSVQATDSAALNITTPAHAVTAAPNTATTAITNSSGSTFYIPYIQTGSSLPVSAAVGSPYVPSGGGVEFVLNQGLAGTQTKYSVGGSSPYGATFTGLAKGTYTLDVYVVNSSDVVQTGPADHYQETNIGLGDIIAAVGDSITAGYPVNYSAVSDWTQAVTASEPISTDDRNYPQEDYFNSEYEAGFLPQLNNLLTTYYGYPVFIMNEGVSSYQASNYDTLMATTQWKNREAALAPDKWLVNLGVNDADNAVSAATYKTNMQTLISNLMTNEGASASSIFVADPNYIQSNPTANTLEAMYLPQISSLVSQDGLSAGPNFYAYFAPYASTLYTDTLHPNSAGYTAMADLWDLPFLTPQNVAESNAQISNNTTTVALNWASLSADNPMINAYELEYGTTPGVYIGSQQVGNVTTGNVVGTFPQGQTYYFAVAGDYSDTTSATNNLTANSSAISLVIPSAGGESYHSLTLSSTGTGSGTISGGNLSCGGDCYGEVLAGQIVTLTATANAGSVFAGWESACSTAGTSGSCTVSMSSDTTVSAVFNLASSTGSGGGGGGGGSTPTVPAPVAPTSPATPPSPTGLSASVLVNDRGTYYLIEGTEKYGITDPGILASYGYTFSESIPATTVQAALPITSNLPPNSGALVKTAADPTVYLISDGQRYGFAFAQVFTSLGYKFSSVLTVTAPELGLLSTAAPLTTSTQAHMSGANVLLNGTVYWIGIDDELHPYPSLAVYNSWNVPNDFSTVVPANSADQVLSVGDAEPIRR